MHPHQYWPICRTLPWPVQKVAPGELQAAGRHCFNKTLHSKPAQLPSYCKWRDSQRTAAVTIFKRLNPHRGWIKKGSSPYARPEDIGRGFFHRWPRNLCQLVASQAGLLFPYFLPRPGYCSLRNCLPDEPASAPSATLLSHGAPQCWR